MSLDRLIENPLATLTHPPAGNDGSRTGSHSVPGRLDASDDRKTVSQDPASLPAFHNEPNADFSKPEIRTRQRAALEHLRMRLGGRCPLVIGGKKRQTAEYVPSTNPNPPRCSAIGPAPRSRMLTLRWLPAARRFLPGETHQSASAPQSSSVRRTCLPSADSSSMRWRSWKPASRGPRRMLTSVRRLTFAGITPGRCGCSTAPSLPSRWRVNDAYSDGHPAVAAS